MANKGSSNFARKEKSNNSCHVHERVLLEIMSLPPIRKRDRQKKILFLDLGELYPQNNTSPIHQLTEYNPDH
jgi:hypothetical protein